jgi:hypothetical protein
MNRLPLEEYSVFVTELLVTDNWQTIVAMNIWYVVRLWTYLPFVYAIFFVNWLKL